MASSSQNDAPVGQWTPQATFGLYNNIAFAIQQALVRMQTATLVRVVSCTNSGGVSEVGFVDVLPMVHQIDGEGKSTPHTTVHNLPYLRIQGGANAVIIDPEPGDIGIAVFASRDISKVKNTKAPGNPGSLRQYSFSDGMYLGGVLNGTPTQYVQYSTAGIVIHSPTLVKLEAPDVQIDCETMEVTATTSATITTPAFTVNGFTTINGGMSQGKGSAGGTCEMLGPVTVTNDVIGQGTSLHTHTHGGVTTGGGNTAVPN